jgi:hypothetical protein
MYETSNCALGTCRTILHHFQDSYDVVQVPPRVETNLVVLVLVAKSSKAVVLCDLPLNAAHEHMILPRLPHSRLIHSSMPDGVFLLNPVPKVPLVSI